MKQRLLVSSILMGLCASLAVTSATAQSGDDQSKKKETLEAVVVTGSLIPQAQIENASPTITITSAQIEKQGYGTVYEALHSLPLSTGAVQGNEFTNGFTPGAQAISLLSLDPGFTLTLINGHPIADYPLLYNGASNFVDLSNIPMGMIDHIDILPGNQSSIYGSSAIAGVINIVLKDKIDGYELNVRGGGYSDGGGQNERLQFLGSNQFGDLSVMYGLQYSNQRPIWGYERDLTASSLSSPNPNIRYSPRDFLYLTYGQGYTDPGSACDSLSGLFGGTLIRQHRSGSGYYCGSYASNSYSSIQNQQTSGTGYLNVKYKLNDSAELYANVLYDVSTKYFSSGPYFWEGNLGTNGYFVNANTGNFELFQHIYAPEEVGNWRNYSTHDIERSYNAWGGIRGTVGTNSTWDYDLFYARSEQRLTEKQYWPLADKVQSFFENQFLGPKLGTYYGYPIYSPNVANFYKAITPAQYASFVGLIQSKNETWTQNLNLVVNNADVLSLPAGSLGLAGLVQLGNQTWSNPTDPAVINGEYYGLTGTSGAGSRHNWAMGLEARVPIVSTFTADLSTRYDQYTNEGGGTYGKVTYKLGLEFRPIDSVLLRANYGTAFRAPDMSYTFGGASGSYSSGYTDYYRCAVTQPGVPLEECKYYQNQQVYSVHQGNKDLSSITAKSWGYGVVWSPTADFNIKADYYHVKIANEVALQSVDTLLKEEADCLSGNLDITSPTCVAAINQVQRTSANSPIPYSLQQVTIYPINIARETVSGIMASLGYRLDIGRFGNLNLNAGYNVTLNHTGQTYPGDPVIDYLRNPYYSSEFKSKGTATIGWDIGSWSSALTVNRYGKTPNYIAQYYIDGYAHAGAGTVAPWTLWNGSVAYSITDQMRVSGIINNIRNAMPPKDSTWTAYPYFNEFQFNPYGRAYWLEFDYKFGGSKS